VIYLAGFIALWVICKLCKKSKRVVGEDTIAATTDDIDEVLVRLDELEELIRRIK
jgi:hypothetical protein